MINILCMCGRHKFGVLKLVSRMVMGVPGPAPTVVTYYECRRLACGARKYRVSDDFVGTYPNIDFSWLTEGNRVRKNALDHVFVKVKHAASS